MEIRPKHELYGNQAQRSIRESSMRRTHGSVERKGTWNLEWLKTDGIWKWKHERRAEHGSRVKGVEENAVNRFTFHQPTIPLKFFYFLFFFGNADGALERIPEQEHNPSRPLNQFIFQVTRSQVNAFALDSAEKPSSKSLSDSETFASTSRVKKRVLPDRKTQTSTSGRQVLFAWGLRQRLAHPHHEIRYVPLGC